MGDLRRGGGASGLGTEVLGVGMDIFNMVLTLVMQMVWVVTVRWHEK